MFLEASKKASLVGAFFVSLLSVSLARADCPVRQDLPRVDVAQVVDGDTLRLGDGRRVRLIGVNAPELGHHGEASQPYAERARQRLRALVDDSHGQVGLAVGRQGSDRYGRVLAHAYGEDGRNLEARLLAEGLGYRVAVSPDNDLGACLRDAEAGARRAGLGVWREPVILAPGELVQGGFALVRGRVARVERNRGGLWLELDGPLVLHIEPERVAAFDGRRLASSLVGQHVEARGWVIDRNRRGGAGKRARWVLPLTDPDMLETLP